MLLPWTRILLGRPWQFDRRVVHDGYTNKYSPMRNNRTITLVPLTPQQVHEDQVKLQQDRVKQKESVREKESERQKRAQESQKKSNKVSCEEKQESPQKKSEAKHECSKRNFFVGAREVRRAFLTNKPMILLLYKEATFLTNSSGKVQPSAIDTLLQEFQDVVVEAMPAGLPPT